MKGKIGIIIFGLLFMFLSCFLYVDDTYTTVVMPRYASTRQMGDMNGDGKITAADVALLYRYVRGNKTVIDSEAIKVADLSGDGKITVSDVSLLYRKLRSITNDDSSKDDNKDDNKKDDTKDDSTKDDNESDSTSDLKEPKSFETDSWDTIIENVKKRNIDAYNVGDEKEILLAGFGKYKVRVANKTTTSECLGTKYSRSACGFVLEFSDILVKNYSLSSKTSQGNQLSTVLNEIYEGLPDELKKGVIDTNVVYPDKETNSYHFMTDKIYLLSLKELSGREDKYSDTDAKHTRQLDYYAEEQAAGKEYSIVKKYDGKASAWGLRSISQGRGRLDRIDARGELVDPLKSFESEPFGISPAFRIGK